MKNKYNIILASQSPRRKDLLRFITNDFKVVVTDFNEESIKEINPFKYAMRLATKKAQEIKREENDLVIGCDTIVIIDNKIIGKPKDKKQAIEYITMLSGRKHIVCTAVSLIAENKSVCFIQKSFVTFYSLNKGTIEEYVEKSNWQDKAGGYGIQEDGALLVKKIDGDYFNICGLPVAKLNKLLNYF